METMQKIDFSRASENDRKSGGEDFFRKISKDY